MPNDTTSTLSLILIAVVLAGTCLLISAPAGQEYGAQAWSSDSILKPIVDAMALYYEHPTPATVDVKGLVLRLGASVAIGIGVIGWFGATRRPIDDDPQGSPTHEPVDPTGSRWTHLAQLMMLVFVAVMLLSRFWSHAPRYTLYAALLLTMQVGWALALARTVNLRGVLISVAVIVAVSAVTAGVGIWYHHERNPVVDLKFPIGNPLFLAACMIPSLVLAPSLIVGLFTSRSARDTWKTWVFVVLLIAGFWSANTALSLTGARSTQAGLAAGVLVFAFLATRRLASSIRRIITAGLLIVVLFGATGAAYWVKGRSEEVAHSQGASLRMRFYAWQYALELFAERPLIGHGRGTVPLLVEAKAADEVLADPMAFFGRAVGHTHHEWLETLAEGGVLGIVLLGAAYVLTFLAGVRALRRDDLTPLVRWSLIGLLTALATMMVEECADVALRIEAFPAFYFTVLGLVWALLGAIERGETPTGADDPNPIRGRTFGAPVRVAGLCAGLAVSAGMIHYAVMDWIGAEKLGSVRRAFDRGEPMLGVRLAADAANNRLDSVRRLEAATTMLTAQSDTAYVILQRANRRFFELAEDPEQRLRLTAEDLVMARNEVDQALNLAHSLNQVVPDLARVAESESRVAPLGGMSIEIGQQLAAQSAPLRSTAAEGSDTAQFIAGLDQFIADGAARIKAFQDRSLQALDRLVRRTPYDERYNLAFWQLNEQLPIREQISLFLRIARAGWVDQGFQAALPQLAARDGFTEIFTSMVDDAQRLADRSDEQLGAVGDAPQVLRLAALLAENERRDADAVALAEAAVKLGRAQDARFPMARVAATTDLARMRLSADPADPTAAVRAAREAIAAAEPWHFARADVDPARHELIAALLAAGDEATAIAEIVALTGQPVAGPTATNPATADPAAIGLGIAYAQLAVRFLEHRLDRRPPSYAGWIERAVALNPEYPMVQEVRARWALQQKNGRDVVDALQRIEQTAGPSPQFETLVQIARTQLPDDPALRAYVEQRAAATQPTTGPSIGPTTVPAPLPPKDTQ